MNFFLPQLFTLGLSLLLVACAADKFELAPDGPLNAPLKPAYLVGSWCTNRDLTAQRNKASGLSALVNLSPVYWRFNAGGKWENSDSGWIFTGYGRWQLNRPNTLMLHRQPAKPVPYSANFENQGKDLVLQDAKAQFLVLSRC